MNDSYETLLSELRKLPGLGYRSAERIAVHVLTDRSNPASSLINALSAAQEKLVPCKDCGNLTETEICSICSDDSRIKKRLCLVENVLDLMAIERSNTWNGLYHILFGKLSPIHGVLPEHLNLNSLVKRIDRDSVEEIVFALSNDIESNATCHYIQDMLSQFPNLKFMQVGFGIPSGGGVTFADPSTLRSAFDSRRAYD